MESFGSAHIHADPSRLSFRIVPVEAWRRRNGSDADNDERIRLLVYLKSTSDTDRVTTRLRRCNVRDVLVNHRRFFDVPPRVTAAQLRLDPRFIKVASVDGSHVFAVWLPTP